MTRPFVFLTLHLPFFPVHSVCVVGTSFLAILERSAGAILGHLGAAVNFVDFQVGLFLIRSIVFLVFLFPNFTFLRICTGQAPIFTSCTKVKFFKTNSIPPYGQGHFRGILVLFLALSSFSVHSPSSSPIVVSPLHCLVLFLVDSISLRAMSFHSFLGSCVGGWPCDDGLFDTTGGY